jgi:predicted PurR-regulated permease PerM
MSSPSPAQTPADSTVAPLSPSLKRISQVALQLVILAALGWILIKILAATTSIAIPVAVGGLLAALLQPLRRFLPRWMPKYAGAGLLLVGFLSLIALGFWISGSQLVEGVTDFYNSLPDILQRSQDWLNQLDLGIGTHEIESALQSAQDWLKSNGSEVAKRALAAGSSAASLVVGAVLALVAAFFLLADGRNMWLWFVGLFPKAGRERLDHAASSGWTAIGAYIRTQTVVAAVDAVGIALGAYFLGLPYVQPIALIVFMTSFIPVLGAFLSGFLAVLVALAFEGPQAAVIMLLVVLVVQQVESNVWQPLLMGKALSLHPFAVILSVSAGGLLAGIAGALFAVPLLAFTKVFLEDLVGDPEVPAEEATPADSPAADPLRADPADASSGDLD